MGDAFRRRVGLLWRDAAVEDAAKPGVAIRRNPHRRFGKAGQHATYSRIAARASARQACSCPFIDIRFDRLFNCEVSLVQAPTRLGSRQALSKGRRQAWGAISWWIDIGPHDPGW